MKRSDLLVNPYKTLPHYRRQGYAAALLAQAAADASRDKLTLYAIVTQDNLASQAALLQAGFQQLGYVGYRPRWFDSAQQYIASEQTSLLLFAFGHAEKSSSLGED